jgi:hypothetical protein
MNGRTVEELMAEYFQLKDASKALRKERNTFMQDNRCARALEGDEDCIAVSGYGHYIDWCDVCLKRHEWYTARQKNAHRCSGILVGIRRRLTQPHKQGD